MAGSLPAPAAGASVDDEAALLGTVAAYPDDDLPRLVYADWLEDRGDDGRADFVRTQVQLAREPEWSPLAVRCKHFRPEMLTGEPWRATLPTLPPRVAAWHPETPFRRGLPDWLVVRDLASFLDFADRLLAEYPVTTLSLPTSTLPFWQDFARRTWLRGVKSLHFYGLSTPIEPLRVLADAPNAAGVESLTLESTASPAVPVVLADLFASPLGDRVKTLDLRVGGDPAGEWLEGIEDLPDGHPLDALDLRTMQLGREGVRRLARSPLMRRLRRFHFRDQPLGAKGAGELLNADRDRVREDIALTRTVSYFLPGQDFRLGPTAATLRRFDVSGNSFLGDAEWGWAGRVGELRSLVLKDCMLDATAVGRLAPRLACRDLVELDLRGNLPLGRAVHALRDAPLARLAALALPGRGLSSGDRADLRRHFADAVVFDDE